MSRSAQLRGRLALAARRLRPALPVIMIAALLALLPFPTCLFRTFLGIPCPGCGLTRATLAAARGDLAGALRFHPLSLGLLALTALTALAALVVSDAAWRRLVIVTTGVAGVALVLVWALRFAGLFGGPVPG